ncbi:helix-turn-helix transcriptional regulator [Amycolatopsis cynarae]|uniref:Helix-turn-helix transcriptional regulator n=1 Tax=Amycolatopsis cynarae TaxID=2995223 RepID=A0ABY7B9D5_9PSEU|nr:helix-turn-helix transcriptional regulator [Amycolatopsis sp. HUAS 11-8]WAL68577.1 helix-turn-helix transcriptional regulator [Amycolatopsis sp. HUAS 11-8]
MDKQALATFLRSRRERLQPEDVGLARGPRRRTPGLRREEVAQLASVSVDHYSRLEQARGRHPSHAVLEGIARALRLSGQERAHLFHLAGQAEQERSGGPSRRVNPATAQLVHRLTDAAALVVDDTCRVLAWNSLAAALFEDFSALSGKDRNVVRRLFLDRGPGGLDSAFTEDDRFATTAVSYLRIAQARYPGSKEIRGLIDELLATSAEFARLWHAQAVRVEHHSRQVFRHPQVGPVELDFDVLTVPGQDQQLVIFTAEPGSRAFETLQLLKVIGTQRLDVPG